MIFKDRSIARKIMNETDPVKMKKLGRKIRKFSKSTWMKEAVPLVYRGNYAKFKQNSNLLRYLLNTRGKLLVEASPYDLIWGAGKSANQLRLDDEFPGANCLGYVLTELREDILEEEGIDSDYKLKWTIDNMFKNPSLKKQLK